jgi:thiol-disulfide isomerase/thioredoxin
MAKSKSQMMVVTKPGCPACENTKPALKKAKSALTKKKVRFAEINADENQTLVEQLGVQAFPEIIYKKASGKIQKMPWHGVPGPTSIVQWADKAASGKNPSSSKKKSKKSEDQCVECHNEGGVNPKIWGPSLWFVIHMMALMYPQNPTAAQRLEAVHFFQGLQKVLPCEYCQKHFAEELKTMDPATFDNRDTLFEWTVKFHDKVSDRTHSKQPRHTINYWRKFYKKAAERAIMKNRKKT